jgi:two-component system, NarL family, nitrate/nitrite response regulator NarL
MRREVPDDLAERIRIVTIDEHELLRAGLCSLLSQEKGFEVVGSASSWPEAMMLIQREQPDVVLYSINADGTNIDFLPELLAVSENTRILALADTGDKELLRRAVRQGAAGVLSKNQPAATLIKAIERVRAGEAWLDRSTTASLLLELSPRNRAVKQDPEKMKIASLTEREREVIRLVGNGLKNRQIAEKLFISDITVHHHLTSIYSKLDVADRLELLIFAYRNGLAQLPGSR